ncbi:TPA: ABC-F family ATP-binding cassette domain-containing protein [Klebsiella pneumoniae]|uniref:ABC-F family ATP-binding cassette domain-containing protein n=1 Tax=Klebsiella pneumoniae TaxID=573 RepID=UPI0018876C05|nr:ABC-F family ATP-binding cassette domain-containing protein [Klebsiella pneumoniae]MDZ2675091.1 ATP-binding cassette domain-containing protein [Klebsiella pneumoniae]
MSTLLTAHALHVETAFGPLFNSLSFTLKKGDRIGLIGHNGCGKSTLLQVLDGTLAPTSGSVSLAGQCLMARVEQHLPEALHTQSLLQAVLAPLPADVREAQRWLAERLLAQMGFTPVVMEQQTATLSGGQHTRLLLARALIRQPDLLLLDEPGNHLDLPTLLWLESFLQTWQGSFVLVSHDNTLLDAVTNASWILRDQTLHCFALPCSAARQALQEQDESAALRHKAEQKEIDRVSASARRLATWGRVYDNEDLARKAKQMEKQVARLRSGDRVAIMGRNGGGKSSLLRLLWQQMNNASPLPGLRLHPRLHPGYYDQTLAQLPDEASLLEALTPFAPSADTRKRALIAAGFGWARHSQKVSTLSGGERSRLLFVGLSLARYSLLLLDEPTNHLDMEGKAALAQTLRDYPGGVLLVSHDRQLISESCNRFWLIDSAGLTEWHSLEEVYARLQAVALSPDSRLALQSTPAGADDDEEALLARLIDLEQWLADDMARKPKHQKPSLQAQWQEEIARLLNQLT